MQKVLVSDSLGERGLEAFKKDKDIQVDVKVGLSPDELKKIIGGYDAIVIRSATKLSADILEQAKNLKVIGRAGVGVDNVDLPAATKSGIIVMNTPQGNTTSTCEHTMAMLLSLSRNISAAHKTLKYDKKWDRKTFTGTELFGKTLGVVGFGRIGREVAKRASAFGMHVLTYDPFISKDAVGQVDAEFVDLKDLLKNSDFITVHTPLTPETKYFIGEKEFKLMRDGVRILNCARGGIINEEALLKALKSGKVAGAALDVFEDEPNTDNPLLSLDNVLATPHLGASTHEAQENVAVSVVQQVCDALLDRGIRNAVNMPSIDPKTQRELGPWITLAERLGKFTAQMIGGSLKKIRAQYAGKVTEYSVKPITLAVVKGALCPSLGDTINYVNAPVIAKERGVEIEESQTSANEDFTNFIHIDLTTSEGQVTVVGTLFGEKDPRIVRVDDFYLDAHPNGWMLVVTNQDKPGFVGEVGTILGQHNINIAEMTLGRNEEGGQAITVMNADQEIPKTVCDAIRKIPQVISLKIIKL